MTKYNYGSRDCFAEPRNDVRVIKEIASRSLAMTLTLLCISFICFSQKSPQKSWNSSRIEHELDKMKHVLDEIEGWAKKKIHHDDDGSGSGGKGILGRVGN